MKLEKEHLTEHDVAHFRQHGMAPAEWVRLDTHVARCEDCLRRIFNPANAHLALSSLTEALLPAPDEKPFHLSPEELKRYNSEKIDEADRIIIESHLEICSECQREAVAFQSAAGPGRAAGRSAEWAARETKSRPGWLPSPVRWPMLWTPARVFGMIAVIGCVLVVLALWIQKRPAQTQDQAAQTVQRSNPTEPAPTGEIAGSNKNESAPAEADNIDSSNNLSEELETSAASVVSLKDGDVKVSLDRQGKLSGLETLAPQTQKAVQTALASEHLSEPQVLNELAGSKIILMGQATDGLPFKLLAPVGIIVNNRRPTLRWQPLDGANLYTVSVFDSDFNRVARSGAQSATQWSVPLSLQNGKLYSWEVTALKDNQEVISPVAPAPRAQFRIVESGNRNEIARVRREHPRSHLTLGVLYARAGLLAEAEREFRALLKDNPQSNVAKRLLRTVQTWRNR